jgi:antitoxin component YwqK of YwqJK toxin-antitoxin module
MKKLLTTILALVSFGVAQAEEDYLEYSIPKNADKYGPIATRESEVTYTKYFRKGADVENDKALIGVEYYRNGILSKRELYKKGKLHGIQKRWHPNEKLEVEAPYKEGIMHGVFQHWNFKGHLLGRYEMKNGFGKKLIFDEAGIIKLLDPYSSNLRTGLHIEQNFKLWSLSFTRYKDGKITGIAYGFRDLKTLSGITYFSDQGVPHGVSVDYRPDGSLQEISFYVHGEKVDKEQFINARKEDHSLPPVFEDTKDYKKHLNAEIVRLADDYKKLEKVKIPLEFNEDGSIVTVSGNPFVLPK